MKTFKARRKKIGTKKFNFYFRYIYYFHEFLQNTRKKFVESKIFTNLSDNLTYITQSTDPSTLNHSEKQGGNKCFLGKLHAISAISTSILTRLDETTMST